MRRVLEVAIRAVQGFLADRCGIYAAGITYFALLSIFPLALLAMGVTGYIVSSDEEQQDLIDRILEEVPLDSQSGRDDLEKTITSIADARGALGAVGIVGLLYSGSALFTAVRTALNGVFKAEKSRQFFIGKAIDIGLVFFFGVLLLVSIGVSVGITIAGRLAEDIAGEDAAGMFRTLMTLAYFLVPPLLSLVTFWLLYAIVPARNVSWREGLAGAAVAAAAFEVLKGGFTQYVAYFGNYDATYGALGFVIIMLFFIYLAAQVTLFGAEVARATEEVRFGWPLADEESRLVSVERKVRSIASKIPGIPAPPPVPAGLPGLSDGPAPTVGAANQSAAARLGREEDDRSSAMLGVATLAAVGAAVIAFFAVLRPSSR